MAYQYQGYWRQFQRERLERAEIAQAKLRALGLMRRIVVPPGVFGLRNGESRIETDSRGNRFFVIASHLAKRSARRHSDV